MRKFGSDQKEQTDEIDTPAETQIQDQTEIQSESVTKDEVHIQETLTSQEETEYYEDEADSLETKSLFQRNSSERVQEIYNSAFRAQDLTIQSLAGKTAEILKFDVGKARINLKSELEILKKTQINYLEQMIRRKQISSDPYKSETNNENYKIEQNLLLKERELLEQGLQLKNQQSSEEYANLLKKVIESRKRILNEMARIPIIDEYGELVQSLNTFGILSEVDKDETLICLRLFIIKFQAQLALHQLGVNVYQDSEEIDPESVKIELEVLLNFQNQLQSRGIHLKKIPDQELEQRLKDLENTYKKAEEAAEQKLDQIEKVQEELRKHEEMLRKTVDRETLLRSYLQMSYPQKTKEQFQETQAQIEMIKRLIDQMPEEDSEKAVQRQRDNLTADALAQYEAGQQLNFYKMISNLNQDFDNHLKKMRQSSYVRSQNIQKNYDKIKTEKYEEPQQSMDDFIKQQMRYYRVDSQWLMKQTTSKVEEWMEQRRSQIEKTAQKVEQNLLINNAGQLLEILKEGALIEDNFSDFMISSLRVALSSLPPNHLKAELGPTDERAMVERLAIEYLERHYLNDPLTIQDVIRKKVEQIKNTQRELQVENPNFYNKVVPENELDREYTEAEPEMTFDQYRLVQMRRLKDLAKEREELERKGTPQTFKFFDKKFEVNKLAFSLKDTLLQIYNDIKQVSETYKLNLTKADESKQMEYVDVSKRNKYLVASKDQQALVNLMVEEVARKRELDDEEAVRREVKKREIRDVQIQPLGGLTEHIYFEGKETQQGSQKEFLRQFILQTKAISDSFAMTGQKESSGRGVKNDVQEALTLHNKHLQESMNEFEKLYGHSVFDQVPLKVEISERVPGSRVLLEEGDIYLQEDQLKEKYGDKYLRALENEKERKSRETDFTTDKNKAYTNSWRQNKENRELLVDQRPNMELIDNTLLRQVLDRIIDPNSHFSRIGQQVLIDSEFSKASTRQQGQFYDIEGENALEEDRYVNNLSLYQQQEWLLLQSHYQNQMISQTLKLRDSQIFQNLEENQPEEIPEPQFGKNKQLDPKLLEKQLAKVEREIKEKYKKEEKMNENVDKQVEDTIHTQRQITTTFDSLIDSSLQISKSDDLYGVDENQIEQILKQMARNMQPFDINAVNKAILSNDSKQHMSNIHNEVETEPIELTQKLKRAETSYEIQQAAKSQKVDPRYQHLASLYSLNSPIRETYLRLKYAMYVNEQVRANFANSILDAKDSLAHLQTYKSFLIQDCEDLVGQFSGIVPPKRVVDFMGLEGKKEEKAESSQLDLIFQTINRLDKFNPESEDIVTFNEEINLQIMFIKQTSLEDGRKLQEINKQIDFVINKIKANKLKPDVQTYSLLFEKSVLLNQFEEANKYLRQLVAGVNPHQSLTNRALEEFFESSLRLDNLDGLALLANYIERHQVSIKDWNIGKMRQSLDFYLNHAFDLNKVLTFLRFYTAFIQDQISDSGLQKYLGKIDQLSEKKKQNLFDEVFGDVESLVDINALFSFLVDKMGSKQFVDPISKRNPLQDLIDLFTSKEIQQIQYMSVDGTTFISPSEIAKYYSFIMEDPSSFMKISKTILKLDEVQSSVVQNFHDEMLVQMKRYVSEHKQLPTSFSEDRISKLYLKIKQRNEEKGTQIGEKTAEFFLYLLKSKGMHAEIIDLCLNFGQLVRNSELSSIKDYYLSEALLHIDIKKNGGANFYSIIDNAVFKEDQNKDSLNYLSQMTKAYMKDGNPEFALSFFEKGIQKRREQRQKTDEYLVTLFDSTFGINDQEAEPLVSLEVFREKYLDMMLVRDKVNKEVEAIMLIDGILERCNSDEADAVFTLQLLLKEERSILKQVAAFNKKDFYYLQDAYAQCKDERDINQLVLHFSNDVLKDSQTGKIMIKEDSQTVKVMKQLVKVFKRRRIVEKSMGEKEKIDLSRLIELQGDDGQVSILGQVKSFDEALKSIGLSKEEFASIRRGEFGKRSEQLIKYISGQVAPDQLNFKEETSREAIKQFQVLAQKLFKANLRTKKEQNLFTLSNDGLLSPMMKFVENIQDNELPQNVIGEIQMAQDSEDEANLDHRNSTDDDTKDLSGNYEYLKEFRKFLQKNPEEDSDEELYHEVMGKKEAAILQQDEFGAALNYRSHRNLQFGIEQFNKIQGQKVPNWFKQRKEGDSLVSSGLINNKKEAFVELETVLNKETDDFNQNLEMSLRQLGERIDNEQKQKDAKVRDPKLVNQAIERFEFLLNDTDSPVISNFMYLLDYKDGSDLPTIQTLEEKSGRKLGEKLEEMLGRVLHQNKRMNELMKSVQEVNQAISNTRSSLSDLSQELKEDILAKSQQSEARHQKREEKVAKTIDLKVKELYLKFIQITGVRGENVLDSDYKSTNKDQQESSLLARTLSREEKIQLMQRAVTLETGKSVQIEVFNSFYALDLVVFGISNQIPEAVRLGERMLSELDEPMPLDIAKAVKQYKLASSEQYQQAMKSTGPIRTPKVEKPEDSDSYNRDTIVNFDDPFWNEYLMKNKRYQDSFRVPSALVWDHKDQKLSDFIDSRRKQHVLSLFEKML